MSFAFEACEVLHEPHVGSCTGLTVLDYSDTAILAMVAAVRDKVIADGKAEQITC